MKSELDVVCAFLAFDDATGASLQSEIRPGRETTDPRSGRPVAATPTALLWAGDQPVAAAVGPVVLVNQGARERRFRALVTDEARRRGREVQAVREPDLWRLVS